MNARLSDIDCRLTVDRLVEAQAAAARVRFIAGATDPPGRHRRNRLSVPPFIFSPRTVARSVTTFVVTLGGATRTDAPVRAVRDARL